MNSEISSLPEATWGFCRSQSELYAVNIFSLLIIGTGLGSLMRIRYAVSQPKSLDAAPVCFKDGWTLCSCRLMSPSSELNDCDGCTDLACDRCIEYYIIDGDDHWYCPCCSWRAPSPPPPTPPVLHDRFLAPKNVQIIKDFIFVALIKSVLAWGVSFVVTAVMPFGFANLAQAVGQACTIL